MKHGEMREKENQGGIVREIHHCKLLLGTRPREQRRLGNDAFVSDVNCNLCKCKMLGAALSSPQQGPASITRMQRRVSDMFLEMR